MILAKLSDMTGKALSDGKGTSNSPSTQARHMEARALSLRNMAEEMDPVSGQAVRRRASAIELLAFALRSSQAPADFAASAASENLVAEAVA